MGHPVHKVADATNHPIPCIGYAGMG